MFFRNDAHRKLYGFWSDSKPHAGRRERAVVYLLASDSRLWGCLKKNRFNVDRTIRLSGNGCSSYSILKAAEDIYSSENSSHISLYDLGERDIISLVDFELIMQAILISR